VLAGDFFFVEVRDRRAVVDPPDPVDCTRDEQHGGDQLRLAASSVADDGDIPEAGGVVDLHTGYPSFAVRVRSDASRPDGLVHGRAG
jgi:hypothetical protein